MREVVIVDSVRTGLAKSFRGKFNQTRPDDMAAHCVNALLTRNGIDPALFPLYLPQDMPQVQADVVVANILAGPLVALAPQLSSLVKPGGRLALSGILAEQGEEVAAAYAQDFDLDPIANRDGWVRISGRRR